MKLHWLDYAGALVRASRARNDRHLISHDPMDARVVIYLWCRGIRVSVGLIRR